MSEESGRKIVIETTPFEVRMISYRSSGVKNEVTFSYEAEYEMQVELREHVDRVLKFAREELWSTYD